MIISELTHSVTMIVFILNCHGNFENKLSINIDIVYCRKWGINTRTIAQFKQ